MDFAAIYDSDFVIISLIMPNTNLSIENHNTTMRFRQ